MSLRLYNSMTHQKETFEPREEGKVGIYACGPTTYNYFHLGNARMLVVFDMIRRYFIYKGYDVTYVQNFTDIDDKIINKAQEEGVDALALAARYIDEYFKDAKELNILQATVHPKATEHIPEMIGIIQKLIDKGLAYAVEGEVYFAVSKFDDYGKLSGRSLEDMQAGARVDVDERKHHPMDFVLWKNAKPGEPAWESPWGMGRPGWHIECTAMSLKYLGESFDIHGGGGDLVFPHHENEIAQSEGYLGDGKTFARYWMHNGFITVKQEKMSKSLGNFFTVREILEHFSGDVIRFYLLNTHYRSPLDFDDEKLVMAQKSLDRLKTSVRLAAEYVEISQDSTGLSQADEELKELVLAIKAEFEEAMDDDFNSSLAIAQLFELAKGLNSHIQDKKVSRETVAQARQTLITLAEVLGFDLTKASDRISGEDETLIEGVMEVLLEVRARARAKKDWETSDYIRDALKSKGVVIEDTPQGARWKLS